MKEKVLEIEIIRVNEDWSTWYITYQNEEVLPRGEFKDDELGVYSFMQHSIFEDEKEGWILNIKGKATHYDITPRILENKYLPILIKKVDEINEKYGIEKLEIERAKEKEYYYFIDYYNPKNLFAKKLECGGLMDDDLYSLKNYFLDKEEAIACEKHLRNEIIKFRKEWKRKKG